MWVELISRVIDFSKPCSIELNTVSKAADQQEEEEVWTGRLTDT